MSRKTASIKKVEFWTSFQIYLKDSIPEAIVEILKNCGYDNAISVSEIDKEDIVSIEEHISNNQLHQNLVDELPVYKNIAPFSFLPGHRKLLLSLPQKVHNFKNKKCRKNIFQVPKSEARSEAGSEVQSNETFEEIELLTEGELIILKEKLFTKLNQSEHAVRINAVFTEANIINAIEPYISHSRVAQRKPAYKCSVKCTKCDKTIPCTHNSHWQVSNLEKHLKLHFEESAESSSSVETSKTHESKTPAKSVEDELKEILHSDSD